MKLITVEAALAADDVEGAVAVVLGQAETVRAMPGCDHYAVYRNDTHLALVQRWQTMEAFESYRASQTFADLITTLKPRMTAPPVTTIASADTVAA